MIMLSHAPRINISYISQEAVSLKVDLKRLKRCYGKELRVASMIYDGDDLAALTVECEGREISIYLMRGGINYSLKFHTIPDPDPVPDPRSEYFYKDVVR